MILESTKELKDLLKASAPIIAATKTGKEIIETIKKKIKEKQKNTIYNP
jgi:hypothetical protein